MKPRYVVVENRHTGLDAIRLLDEPFAGIVYCYNQVNLSEDEESGTAFINFDYEILDKSNKEFGSMEPFEQYISQILQQILYEHITKDKNERTT